MLISLAGVLLSLLLLCVGFVYADTTAPPVIEFYSGNTSKHCSSHSWCTQCSRDPECGFCFHKTPTGGVNGSCLPVNQNSLASYPDASSALTGPCTQVHLEKGDTVWNYDMCPSPAGWVVVLGMTLYLAFFSIGMGPIPWTFNAEIYPLWARGTASALSTATNWTFNLIISMTFLSLSDAITKAGAFGLYSALAVLGLIFIFLFIPETKGRSLEDMEVLFLKPFAF